MLRQDLFNSCLSGQLGQLKTLFLLTIAFSEEVFMVECLKFLFVFSMLIPEGLQFGMIRNQSFHQVLIFRIHKASSSLFFKYFYMISLAYYGVFPKSIVVSFLSSGAEAL